MIKMDSTKLRTASDWSDWLFSVDGEAGGGELRGGRLDVEERRAEIASA